MSRIPATSVIVLLLLGASLSAQSAGNDTQNISQTSQELVREIRALRMELAASNTTMQRVQIALYRLYQQQKAKERAAERLEQCRQQLAY